MASPQARHRALAIWRYLYTERARVGYPPGDVRTMTINHVDTFAELEQLVDSGKLEIDCSQTVQLVCHVAGWRSPSGTYAIDGYTGTMLAGPCRHFSDARLAFLMSIVVFGPGTGVHTAFVIEPDHLHGNPLLGSHGGPGMDRVRLRDMSRYLPAPVTFLSVLDL